MRATATTADGLGTETAGTGAFLGLRRAAARFCGPPGIGNGGYVAGCLAEACDAPGPLEVTLRRPAPLDTPLALRRTRAAAGGAWHLATCDGRAVASARPAPGARRPAPPALPTPAELAAAGRHAHDTGAGTCFVCSHPFPDCFVCGPARAPGDGLRILPTRVGGRALVAAPWRPAASLAGADGRIAAPFVWAALDCPGYFGLAAAAPLRPMLLGRITGWIDAAIHADEPLVVLGWGLGSAGRRHHGPSALLDRTGPVRAPTPQVWMEPEAAVRSA